MVSFYDTIWRFNAQKGCERKAAIVQHNEMPTGEAPGLTPLAGKMRWMRSPTGEYTMRYRH
jgi:hypothetical protein